MKDITKKYSNGEVTIVWRPSLCIHSTKCFSGLGEVFDPRKRPWITPEGATTDRIIAQVKNCPSGALTYLLNREGTDETEETESKTDTVIEPATNGPLMVYGPIAIKDTSGQVTRKSNVTALCRCGGSANKPYCDGSHKRNGFEG